MQSSTIDGGKEIIKQQEDISLKLHHLTDSKLKATGLQLKQEGMRLINSINFTKQPKRVRCRSHL